MFKSTYIIMYYIIITRLNIQLCKHFNFDQNYKNVGTYNIYKNIKFDKLTSMC